jgi:N-acyl-D-aspartate/D-glutamate deacylase
MAEFDTIVRGGTIIDGTRMPRFKADIGIKDGRIVRIGHLKEHEARNVIDATGLCVVPGYIDLHTHYDAPLFWDPYCSISSWHGVTSVVIGNCGFGFAPCHPADRDRSMLTMTRNEAIPYACMKAGMPWDWETFPQFLDSVERRPKGVNLLPYVPLSPLITYVMGLEAAKTRKPTDGETNEMCRLLDEAMDVGGCGWSAQRLHPSGGNCVQRDFDGTPMVTDLMHNETALALARVLRRRNQGFIQTVLSTADPMADMRHLEELAEVSGRPLIYNALRSTDSRPEGHRYIIKWLENCHTRGLRIYPQAITTDAGLTFDLSEDLNIFDDSEPWCEAMLCNLEDKLHKLGDPARRPALRDNVPHVATDFWDIIISEVKKPEHKNLEGLTLAAAGTKLGKHYIDAMLDLAVSERLRTEFFARAHNTRLDLQIEVATYPYAIPGLSDGGAHTKYLTGGIYPTEYIIKYVRENNAMSLEDAHWKLSALPAYCAGFTDRGLLHEGYAADLVIYDYNGLKLLPQEIAHDMPAGEWRRVQRAEGYRYIMVNGEVEFVDGRPTGALAGSLLRHGAAPQIRQAA